MGVGDEAALSTPTGSAPPDNSAFRLLALSDAVFAIAMTLLALDLKVPDVGKNPTSADLAKHLVENSSAYFSFLISFYIVASYWGRHHRLMRAVETTQPALTRDTLLLLFLVAAMPFLASLIGRYGGVAIALAIYGAVNALASLTLMSLSRDVRRLHTRAEATQDYSRDLNSWVSLGTFLLCIPAGYALGRHGPYVLLLLAVSRVVGGVRQLASRHRPG